MGPDLTPAAPTGATCPSCRASVRYDADWCSLCYTVLRAPEPREAVAAAPVPVEALAPGVPDLVVARPRHAAPDPLTGPLIDVLMPPVAALPAPTAGPLPTAAPEPTWPCTSCGASNPLSAEVCSRCGRGFLAAASSAPRLVLPVVGDLAALSRGQRIAAALGAVALFLVPVALVTFLLTGGGPAETPTTSPGVTEVSAP